VVCLVGHGRVSVTRRDRLIGRAPSILRDIDGHLASIRSEQ
jgi:hypothetical protein